jgi:hypothetical protein
MATDDPITAVSTGEPIGSISVVASLMRHVVELSVPFEPYLDIGAID